jgi:hypothetical protein
LGKDAELESVRAMQRSSDLGKQAARGMRAERSARDAGRKQRAGGGQNAALEMRANATPEI